MYAQPDHLRQSVTRIMTHANDLPLVQPPETIDVNNGLSLTQEDFSPASLDYEQTPELEECSEFYALMDAKEELRQCVDERLEELFVFERSIAGIRKRSALLRLNCHFLMEIARDDSPIATKGVEGLGETVRLIIEDTVLHEQIGIAPSRDLQPLLEKRVQQLHLAQLTLGAAIDRADASTPVPLRIFSALSPQLQTYGSVLQLNAREVIDDLTHNPFYYKNGQDAGIVLNMGDIEFGRMAIEQKPYRVSVVDWHLETAEVLVPDRPVIILLGRREELRDDYFASSLFVVPAGAVIKINTGVLHMTPFSLVPGMMTTPVVFRRGTTSQPKDWSDLSDQGEWHMDLYHQGYPYSRRFLPSGFESNQA